VLEREVGKMLKDMLMNPIARTNVISPVANEAGGNQVSFKKQNLSILDQSRLGDDEQEEQEHEEVKDDILTHHTSMAKSPSDANLHNPTSTKKAKERKQTLVRLGIRDEADLIHGNMECVKMLIITDFIIIVCKHRRLMV
jgi:hypothetical protein